MSARMRFYLGWLALAGMVVATAGVLILIPLLLGGPWWGLIAPVGAGVGFVVMVWGLFQGYDWAMYMIREGRDRR